MKILWFMWIESFGSFHLLPHFQDMLLEALDVTLKAYFLHTLLLHPSILIICNQYDFLRFEWHYTPKHGSWLDMAEIEIGVMSRQALAKPFPDLESFEKQVRNLTIKRNARCVKINWQFTTADARIKLAKLYPTTL